MQNITSEVVGKFMQYALAVQQGEGEQNKKDLLFVPKEFNVITAEPFRENPNRIRQYVPFVETDSFLDYAADFVRKENNESRLFAAEGWDGYAFLLAFDYHTAASPSWVTHLALLKMQHDPAYATFLNKNDQWFDQEKFALFIEENLQYFVEPDGATMLELAQHLKGARNVNFQSGKRLANGEVKLEYVETIEARSARGEVIVPEYIALGMPIYTGQEAKRLKTAFRWKIDGANKVQFSYKLLTQEAEQMAQREAREKIEAALEMKTHLVRDFSFFDWLDSRIKSNMKD